MATKNKNLILNPPKYIINDNYLNKYYFSNKEFKEFILKNYTKIKIFSGSSYNKKWNIDVYKLKNNYIKVVKFDN